MCYMDERQVGVRELRQNLSKYLRRVERGERLEVTERGRPVAVLAPLEPADSPIARLVAAGRAIEPTTDILSLLPPSGRVSTRAGRALLEDRAERL
jgi:prevent-host-death family protein